MFTSNQIEEIRRKLQLGGTKDTQFPLADSLKGNETIAIVQQGVNKQLGLKTLLESVTKWSVSDFLNISKSNEDSYSLEEVLRLIAPINRKAGQVITFKDRMLGTWSIYQFKGESAEDWFNLEYWDDILAKVDNHFKGLILNDCILNETYPRPMVGDFAFVGSTLEEAVIYICYNYGHWHNTEEPALDINEELKTIVEEVFNNVEKYPELVQVISSVTPVYAVDYNNYTADDFIKIKETIDKGGIITVSNINILGLANNNVYHVKSVSDYSITLNTLVQNEIIANSDGAYPDNKIYVFTSIDIMFIKTGNKSITEKKFKYSLGGGGDKFLSDDGSYHEISKEVYYFNYDAVGLNDFNNVYNAISKGYIINVYNIPDMDFMNNTVFNVLSKSSTSIQLVGTRCINGAINGNKTDVNITTITITLNSDNTRTYKANSPQLEMIGDGTKFLANDGNYKDVGNIYNFDPMLFSTSSDFDKLLDALDNGKTICMNAYPVFCLEYDFNNITLQYIYYTVNNKNNIIFNCVKYIFSYNGKYQKIDESIDVNSSSGDFRTKVDITDVVIGITDEMSTNTVTINQNIYNDLTLNGGNTLFYYSSMDHATLTEYSSANVPYCAGADRNGMFICFNCMTPSGFKAIKCKLTQTTITFDSVIS